MSPCSAAPAPALAAKLSVGLGPLARFAPSRLRAPQRVEAPKPLLAPGMILKADYYPGVHRLKTPEVPGAANLRSPEPGLVGVAQPTVEGIRAAVALAGPRPVWLDMREEPVLYIDGVPYNLREQAHPFDNLEAPGRSARDLETLERRLRDEVVARGTLTVHSEGPNGELVPREVAVSRRNVQTPRQVFDSLGVELVRIPVTDEERPADEDFRALVDTLLPRLNRPVIANCHAGRGRTTTALVLASIMRDPKQDLDALLTRFSNPTHLAYQAAEYEARAAKEPDEEKRAVLMRRSRAFDERYLYIRKFADWAARGYEGSL